VEADGKMTRGNGGEKKEKLLEELKARGGIGLHRG